MTLFSILVRNLITTPGPLIGVGHFLPNISAFVDHNPFFFRTFFDYSYIHAPIHIIYVFLAHTIRVPVFGRNIGYVSRQRSRFRHVIRQSSNLHVPCALIKTSNLVSAITYSESVVHRGFCSYAGRKIILFYYPFFSFAHR